jgi:16S rRNA (guanine527-N7)-methyltransferase
MDRDAFGDWATQVGLHQSEAQLDAISAFLCELYERNAVMNLTRIKPEEAWLRHIADSLLFQDILPRNATVLDIGTGPGLPAWPLALLRTDLAVTALDSSGKMLGFLRSQPLPNLTVVEARAEDWSVRNRFDIVTGRAVAPLPIQLEISAAPCRVGGAVIPMRTGADDLELSVGVLGLILESVVERTLPGTEIQRVFPVFRKEKPTPGRYPRRWAEIRARPI